MNSCSDQSSHMTRVDTKHNCDKVCSDGTNSFKSAIATILNVDSTPAAARSEAIRAVCSIHSCRVSLTAAYVSIPYEGISKAASSPDASASSCWWWPLEFPAAS